MKILLNGKEYLLEKKFDSLNSLLQNMQEYVSNEKMTITQVVVDGIDHNIDFFDKNNDISCEFIENIAVEAKTITSVCIGVMGQMSDYLEKVNAAIPSICDNYRNKNHIDATQDLYNILEGLKYFNIAFNSMASMGVLDMESNTIDGVPFWNLLADANDSFLLVSTDLQNGKYEEAAQKIESEISPKIRTLSLYVLDFKNQIIQ